MSRAFATLLVLFTAASAWACPVCGAATDTKGTYINMTLIMSGLPLLMIGSVVFFVARAFRRAEREARPAVFIAPPPQQ